MVRSGTSVNMKFEKSLGFVAEKVIVDMINTIKLIEQNLNSNSHLTQNLSVCLYKVMGLFDPGKDTIQYNYLLSLLNDTH